MHDASAREEKNLQNSSATRYQARKIETIILPKGKLTHYLITMPSVKLNVRKRKSLSVVAAHLMLNNLKINKERHIFWRAS